MVSLKSGDRVIVVDGVAIGLAVPPDSPKQRALILILPDGEQVAVRVVPPVNAQDRVISVPFSGYDVAVMPSVAADPCPECPEGRTQNIYNVSWVVKPTSSGTGCPKLATGYWGGIQFDANSYIDESVFFNVATGGFDFVDTHRLVRVGTDGDSACYWNGFPCNPDECQIYFPPFDGDEPICEFISNNQLFIYNSDVCSEYDKVLEYQKPPFVWYMQRYAEHFAIWNVGPSVNTAVRTSTFYGHIDLDDCSALSGTVLANELIFGEDMRVINTEFSLLPVATGGSILIS